MKGITARLDRSELRVLCGTPSCGAVLAYVELLDGVGGVETTLRRLYFEHGFSEGAGGVWGQSRRAERRAQQGHRPGTHHARTARTAVTYRVDEESGESHLDFDTLTRTATPHPFPAALPALVRCKTNGGCARINLLDPRALRIDLDAQALADGWREVVYSRLVPEGRRKTVRGELTKVGLCACCSITPRREVDGKKRAVLRFQLLPSADSLAESGKSPQLDSEGNAIPWEIAREKVQEVLDDGVDFLY